MGTTTDAHGPSNSLLRNPIYRNALRAGFEVYDKDKDGHLDYQEFSSYYQACEGEQLSKEVFDQLGLVIDTNASGNISFNGFLAMYLSVYEEKGLAEGDANLEKDLKIFGLTPPPPPPPPPKTMQKETITKAIPGTLPHKLTGNIKLRASEERSPLNQEQRRSRTDHSQMTSPNTLSEMDPPDSYNQGETKLVPSENTETIPSTKNFAKNNMKKRNQSAPQRQNVDVLERKETESILPTKADIIDVSSPFTPHMIKSGKASGRPISLVDNDQPSTQNQDASRNNSFHPFFTSKRVVAKATDSSNTMKQKRISTKKTSKQSTNPSVSKPASKRRKNKKQQQSLSNQLPSSESESSPRSFSNAKLSGTKELERKGSVSSVSDGVLFLGVNPGEGRKSAFDVLKNSGDRNEVEIIGKRNGTPLPTSRGDTTQKAKRTISSTFSGREGKLNPLFSIKQPKLCAKGAQLEHVSTDMDKNLHNHPVGSYLPETRDVWKMVEFPTRNNGFIMPNKASNAGSTLFMKMDYALGVYEDQLTSALQNALSHPTPLKPLLDLSQLDESSSNSRDNSEKTLHHKATSRGTADQVSRFLDQPLVIEQLKTMNEPQKENFNWYVNRRMRGILGADAWGNYKASNCPSLPCKLVDGHGALPWELQWTDKYRPDRCDLVCGNRDKVEHLKKWLVEWKLQISRSEVRPQQPFRGDDGSDSDDDFLPDDDDVSRDMDEFAAKFNMLSRAQILQGPCGSGKTAAVYACASELGYEVIELNASSVRSGSSIRSTFGDGSQNLGLSLNSKKRGSSTLGPNKTSSEKDSKKKKLFNKTKGHMKLPMRKVNALQMTKDRPNNTESTVDANASVSLKPKLILIEEAEIQFESDRGFDAAIQNLLMTTCCPIVLCCNSVPPEFTNKSFPVILQQFVRPSIDELQQLVSSIGLAEGRLLCPEQVRALVVNHDADIRATILTLQFWMEEYPHSKTKGLSCAPSQTFEKDAERVLFSKQSHPLLNENVHVNPENSVHDLETLHDLADVSSGGRTASSNCVEAVEDDVAAVTSSVILCPITTRFTLSRSIHPFWYSYLEVLENSHPHRKGAAADPITNTGESGGSLAIKAVEPPVASVTGGTTILIKGCGFLDELKAVQSALGSGVDLVAFIDGIACSEVEVLSNYTLKAISPPCYRLSRLAYVAAADAHIRHLGRQVPSPVLSSLTKASRIGLQRLWPSEVRVLACRKDGAEWGCSPRFPGAKAHAFEYSMVPALARKDTVAARQSKRKESPVQPKRRRGRPSTRGKRLKSATFSEFETAFKTAHGQKQVDDVSREVKEVVDSCIKSLEQSALVETKVEQLARDMVDSTILGVLENGKLMADQLHCAQGNSRFNVCDSSADSLEALQAGWEFADSVSLMDNWETSTGTWEDIYASGGRMANDALPPVPPVRRQKSSGCSFSDARLLPQITAGLEHFISKSMMQRSLAENVLPETKYVVAHGRHQDNLNQYEKNEIMQVGRQILRQLVPSTSLGPSIATNSIHGLRPYLQLHLPYLKYLRKVEMKKIAAAVARQGSRRRKLRFISQIPSVELDDSAWARFDQCYLEGNNEC